MRTKPVVYGLPHSPSPSCAADTTTISILQVRKLRYTDTRERVGAEPGFESGQALALNHRATLPPLFLQGPLTPSFNHPAHTRQSRVPCVPGTDWAACQGKNEDTRSQTSEAQPNTV